jgi:hypothetical protein
MKKTATSSSGLIREKIDNAYYLWINEDKPEEALVIFEELIDILSDIKNDKYWSTIGNAACILALLGAV